MRDDEHRPVGLLDDIGHGERLSRTGHSHQDQMFNVSLQAFTELLDSFRLVTFRAVFRMKLLISEKYGGKKE